MSHPLGGPFAIDFFISIASAGSNKRSFMGAGSCLWSPWPFSNLCVASGHDLL